MGESEKGFEVVSWKIVLTREARKMLAAIQDRRVMEKIRDRLDGLVNDPEKQGKPLVGELTGYRSLRVVGQRYRIIYRVDRGKVIVIVVAVGIRKEQDKKDIYALAKKLIKLEFFELS